jgi:hypothetical protein
MREREREREERKRRYVPECCKLSEKEGVMLERNQGQFVQHPIPYSQHHRNRRCNRHLHRPIQILLTLPPLILFHFLLLHCPILAAALLRQILYSVRARAGAHHLLLHAPAVRSLPRPSASHRFHNPQPGSQHDPPPLIHHAVARQPCNLGRPW